MPNSVIPKPSNLTAIILAGGLGTRLRSVVSDRPKPLAEVKERPFITYILQQLDDLGIRKAILCVGHQADKVQKTLGTQYGKIHIDYSVEEELLGTGGALRLAAPLVKEDFVLVLNGDSYCKFDLDQLLREHTATQTLCTVVLTQVPEVSRYGSVDFDDQKNITRFAEKASRSGKGWINAGIYLLSKEHLYSIAEATRCSLETDIFPTWLGKRFKAFLAGEAPFIDIGLPESYAHAGDFFKQILK